MAKTTATRDGETLTPAAPLGRAGVGAQVGLVIQEMRPKEWTKNLLLFAGVIFAGHALQVASVGRAVLAVLAYCAASGAVYLFNDLMDIRRDRIHPTKRYRPLASGALGKRAAIIGLVVAVIIALGCGLALRWVPLGGTALALAIHVWPPALGLHAAPHAVPTSDPYTPWGGSVMLFIISLVAYWALQVGYTLKMKHVVLLDVFAIAAGFVLRTLAGAVAVAVPISPWLYLCTVLLSLFLALGKRRQEALMLAEGAALHRASLSEYSLPLLDQLITIVTSGTIMAYSLYTFQSETAGDRRLMVTIPFVIYGIFRYLYLMQVRREGGNPAEVLLRDRHMQVAIIGWVAVVSFVLYVVPR
ncbi:MAG: decaprenyl-phosphate phosphoribosyltransferase [Ktedonobacterales bacterium]|nr:decaprenyl-phosphate phosphoribosyltransferase [Ktedonobacterales bacterium]